MSLYLGMSLSIAMQRGGFSPSSLFDSGEEGSWYDPSDISTLFQDDAGLTPITADGQTVGRMLDKSGNGNHAIQATAGKRPTYKTSGGFSWLDFDGIDDSLDTTAIDFTGSDEMVVFAGLDVAGEADGMIVELSNAESNGSFYLYQGATASDFLRFQSKGTVAISVDETVGGTTWTRVITVQSKISTPTASIRTNGNLEATVTTSQGTGNFGNHKLYIGMRGGTSLPFDGKMYGLITRGTQPSALEVSQTEAYLAGKSGVTL